MVYIGRAAAHSRELVHAGHDGDNRDGRPDRYDKGRRAERYLQPASHIRLGCSSRHILATWLARGHPVPIAARAQTDNLTGYAWPQRARTVPYSSWGGAR